MKQEMIAKFLTGKASALVNSIGTDDTLGRRSAPLAQKKDGEVGKDQELSTQQQENECLGSARFSTDKKDRHAAWFQGGLQSRYKEI